MNYDEVRLEYDVNGNVIAKRYYLDSKFHRIDGPAIEWKNTKKYFIKGKLHRLNGPAVIYEDGSQEYYIDGKLITEHELLVFTTSNSTAITLENYDSKQQHHGDGPRGFTTYTLRDVLHRLDGPAFIWGSGSKSWYLNGRLHRLDGPANVGDYFEKWYLNGRLHRLDGPAVTYSNGNKEYYIDDKKLTEKEFLAATLNKTSENSPAFGTSKI